MTSATPIDHSMDQLRKSEGATFGPGDWVELNAGMLQKFSEATYLKGELESDWRIAQNNELGSKLIDGFLLISLIMPFHGSVWPFYEDGTWALNYGLDRVRFLEPVFVGERVRMSLEVKQVEDRESGLRVVTSNVLEVEGKVKPAMVADWVILYLPQGADQAS